MKRLLPFRAVRFTEKAKKYPIPPISLPYDKIREEHLREYEKNPYNISKIILPGGIYRRDYSFAAKLYRKFLEDGILKPDSSPSFYIYTVEFQFRGRHYRRKHLVGLLKLPEKNENYVFPHERTFPKTVEDRLNLLRSTGVNYGLVFLLGSPCPYPEGNLEDSFNLHGETHTLYRVGDPEEIKRIADCYEESVFVIADGHHRFKTSLIYRDEMRKRYGPGGPYDYRMVAITSTDDPGIVILPTHRATVNEIVPEGVRMVKSLTELLTRIENDRRSIGIVTRSGFFFLSYESDLPGAEFLEREIFSRIPPGEITYFRTPEEGLKLLEKGQKTLFILNPPEVETVWNYATEGRLLPQKSTDFYPKVASGITLFDHRLSFTFREE